MKVQIKIPKPHANQFKILKAHKRFTGLRCGRRFGKTTLTANLAIPALEGKKIGIWNATYKDLAEVWYDLKQIYQPVTVSRSEQNKSLRVVNDGIIDFWSMDDPDSGRGRAYHRAIVDEFAKAKKNKAAWQGTIRPTLTDYRGDGWIFSTPKGKSNYFYELEQATKNKPDWVWHHYGTQDNPYIPKQEIIDAKSTLDELYYRQEYLAENVDLNDSPFMYNFSEDNIIPEYSLNPALPVYLSLDFNINPITCIVAQRPDKKTLIIFDEIQLNNSDAEKMGQHLLAKYPAIEKYLTGDASGRTRNSTNSNITSYSILINKLNIPPNHFLVRKKNISISDSRVLCNSVVHNTNFYVTANCKQLIHDMGNALVDENGELIKDRGVHKNDALDASRYLIDAVYPDFIQKPHKYM